MLFRSKIGICTDVHLPTMHDSEYRITTFIDAMKKEKPDFIIELGDFLTPEPKYAKYYDIWKSFTGDKYHVIGNHEMDGGTSREKALEYRNMPTSYYSFKKNGFHFIVLDGNDKKNPQYKVIGCFNGHTHYDYAENIGGIWYITITSMSYHWLGDNYQHIRYSDEVDKNFKWIKFTAPFKEPLFTTVEISTKGTIKIAGKKTEWVGPTPWELGYPGMLKKYIRPEISKRKLRFRL